MGTHTAYLSPGANWDGGGLKVDTQKLIRAREINWGFNVYSYCLFVPIRLLGDKPEPGSNFGEGQCTTQSGYSKVCY